MVEGEDEVIPQTEAGRRLAALPLIDGDDAPLDLSADIRAIEDEARADCVRERDLAIAHDRQPYPTVWAYEQACKARDEWKAKAEARSSGEGGLEELRGLSDAATPGPWSSLTHGTASQRDAAGLAFMATMAVHAPGNPDVQFTDVSWVETAPDGPHIAFVGNGAWRLRLSERGRSPLYSRVSLGAPEPRCAGKGTRHGEPTLDHRLRRALLMAAIFVAIAWSKGMVG